MVEFDVTDYLDADEGNNKIMKEWLKLHVGGTDLDWYLRYSSSAHALEGKGEGWRILFQIGKVFRPNRYPLSLLCWIVQIEDDLAAVQFKMIWPEAAIVSSTVAI
jgi:hypothetical protein